MSCYFGAEACARGHVVDCPAREGDPWAGEVTQPMSDAEYRGTLRGMVLNGGGEDSGWREVAEDRWVLDA